MNLFHSSSELCSFIQCHQMPPTDLFFAILLTIHFKRMDFAMHLFWLSVTWKFNENKNHYIPLIILHDAVPMMINQFSDFKWTKKLEIHFAYQTNIFVIRKFWRKTSIKKLI